jgi:hypothetical protein
MINARWEIRFALFVFLAGVLRAQLTTGVMEGTLCSTGGRRLAGESIVIAGAAGLRILVRTNSEGEFFVPLPYGRYGFSRPERRTVEPPGAVFVPPLGTAHVSLIKDAAGEIRAAAAERATHPGAWADHSAGRRYPGPFSLGGLLNRAPFGVTVPLDFTGLGDNRPAVASERGLSWTSTQYKLHGLDATDSYQPGRPVIFPDVQALDEVLVRSAFAQAASSSEGAEAGLFLGEARSSWHGSLFTANTGAALSSDNLPPPAKRGWVRQSDRFQWLTRDRLELGGPVTRWADIYVSGTGQWASQTEPLAAPGATQGSRLLFGNARGRARAGAADQVDAMFSGSRIDLSSGGAPAGIEAWTGNRMAPSFVLPGGFSGQREEDHLDFVQTGWTHVRPDARAGVIEVRYGYSTAHLDTSASQGQSRIELLGGGVTGPPPLANLAVRTRHEIQAAWQPAAFFKGVRRRIVVWGGWKRSSVRNRFLTPSDIALVTANGEPAFVIAFNTPLDSRALVQSFSAGVADHLVLRRSLSIDAAVMGDFARGSLPAQSSPAGSFTPARYFAAQRNVIAWSSASPRAGFAWRVPGLRGLVVRGAYSRRYAPLAGRYLDFGNPNSLGGTVYQWITPDPGATFQLTDRGGVLLRFGGPYSSISPALGRPYADEFDAGAEFSFGRRGVASIHLFRRDGKNRIAAINTGAPGPAFHPVSITDPGPDGIPATFDDQQLTVFAQDPATLGRDEYVLTNPAGLRMLNTGLLAQWRAEWRALSWHASFAAEKSYGPTNPGDAFYENDPGVTGALFLDPNTAIHAAGRIFMDRAFLGKIQAVYRLPARFGGIELASVANYADGLVFARRLLVTGLPQGPLLAATTVRGSPEGGNRAEYAINWNLRISRRFRLPAGSIALAADILNVTNAAQKLQESDLSGPLFNLRLPVAIQPPRFVRLGFRYEF